jgi:hypothetical protein
MVRLPHYSRSTGRGTRGVLMGPCVDRSAWGSGTGRAAHSQRGRTEYEHARGYCERYRVPHGAGPLRRLLPAYSRPRAARARARQCDGACRRTQGCLWTPTGRGARTQAHGAASRAGRAHRAVSCLSSDSAAGIVPSSELLRKFLRRAWFVPLCSEMLMHRSVPRTHTSTNRGGAECVPSSCPGDEEYSSRAAVRAHLP